ncbi:uncharacterized protein LOC132737042 [Ruditapes philippinarum]|uniref:uncharacterized protein LOC132737042 n=1 Tax=Ruditapes philippinarum TaxID=129788 RepID=UPI00295AC4D7|nr:uncharacterized protein LOC132737042 [Ruditapes philippinarum]
MGGNTSKVKAILEPCLERVEELDEAMLSFLKSLDMMTATLRVIAFYHSSNETATVSDSKESIIFGDMKLSKDTIEKKLTKDVLCCIEESISCRKNDTLQKLRKLLRIINDLAKEHAKFTPKALQVDEYKDDPSFENFFKDNVVQVELKKLQDKQNMLKEQLALSQKREDDFVKEKKKILAEKSALYELNDKKEKENEKLRNQVSNIKQEFKKQIHEQMDAEKEQLLTDIRDGKTQIERLKSDNEQLKSDLNDERNVAEELRVELESFKCKKVLQVQLFYQRRGGLIAEVEEDLKKVLKTRLEDGKTELKFITCNSSSEVNNSLPTLLIAICASRIGTDAANAIQGLDTNFNRRILLLIFHHKDIHALPSQASERVLTAPEFKSLGGIHDMAFLTQKGIYDCEMNEKSITTVTSFITSI